MQKFSFEEKKDLLILNNAGYRPPLDKNGKEMNGDEFLRMTGKIISAWEKKNNKPVPMQNQKFINWVKQACKELDNGKSSKEIFSRTIVPKGGTF